MSKNLQPADAAAPAAEKPKPVTMLVLDTTAVPEEIENGRVVPGTGKRVHEMIIDGGKRPFTFEYGKPLPLPPEIALKFLKHEAFKLVDENGVIQPFKRAPKQPDELQAGESLVLGRDETVARYEELSSVALQHRVLEMPGGEQFAKAPTRGAMIAFILARKDTLAKLNTAKPEVGSDAFVPEAEVDDELAA